MAEIISPYTTHFWICNMMEAQAFVFTYRDYQDIPGIMLDRIRHIQSKRLELRNGAERG